MLFNKQKQDPVHVFYLLTVSQLTFSISTCMQNLFKVFKVLKIFKVRKFFQYFPGFTKPTIFSSFYSSSHTLVLTNQLARNQIFY